MSNDDKTVILLIDGNNIAFRAASILPVDVLDSDDTRQADRMVSKRVNIMRALYADVIPVYFFDEPRNNFMPFDARINRKHEDTDYKANRRKPGDDNLTRLRAIWIQRWMQAKYSDNQHVLAYPGAEADDMIAYVSSVITSNGSKDLLTAIWSADKDLLQCVNDANGVYQIRKKPGSKDEVKYTESTVFDVKGVPPSKIRMQLALQGDSADGYHGVNGYGAKRGLKLINDSDSFDDIINALPDSEDLLRENWILAGMGKDYLPTNAITRVNNVINAIIQ